MGMGIGRHDIWWFEPNESIWTIIFFLFIFLSWIVIVNCWMKTMSWMVRISFTFQLLAPCKTYFFSERNRKEKKNTNKDNKTTGKSKKSRKINWRSWRIIQIAALVKMVELFYLFFFFEFFFVFSFSTVVYAYALCGITCFDYIMCIMVMPS